MIVIVNDLRFPIRPLLSFGLSEGSVQRVVAFGPALGVRTQPLGISWLNYRPFFPLRDFPSFTFPAAALRGRIVEADLLVAPEVVNQDGCSAF
jgi:hypothetical protein